MSPSLLWLSVLFTVVLADLVGVGCAGVKLCDPDGGMMEHSWEEHATRLANADERHVCECVRRRVEETETDCE